MLCDFIKFQSKLKHNWHDLITYFHGLTFPTNKKKKKKKKKNTMYHWDHLRQKVLLSRQ